MGKDAYWFRHDSNASRDIKLMKLRILHDFWGIGVYWTVIELLREQNNYCFASDESSLQLACNLIGCNDFVKFKSWFFDAVKFGLFNVENDVFFSISLRKRMGKWESSKDNGGKGGRPKKTQSKPNNKPNQNPTHNPTESIRGDKSIEEKKKGEIGFVFFEEKYKIEAEYFHDGIRYGNSHQRGNGGLSVKALKEHCKEMKIEYVEQ